MSDRTTKLLLLGLILLTLAKGVWWATTLPPYSGPDEVWHLDYLRHLAEEGQFPVYGRTMLLPHNPTVSGNDLTPNSGYSLEAFQPPLGYLIPALFFPSRPLAQLLTFARLTNVLLGVGIVLLVYISVRSLAPTDPLFALTAAGLVALQPTLSFLTSTFNNDALAVLLGTATFACLVRALRRGTTVLDVVCLGGLVGIGFLTKLNLLLFGPSVLLVLVWTSGTRRRFFQRFGIATATALVTAGWWEARTIATYHGWSELPTLGSGAVYSAQPFSSIGSPLLLALWPGYWIATVKSFFGFFSWDYMIDLPQRFTLNDAFLAAVTLLGLVGVIATVASFRQPRRPDSHDRVQRQVLGLSLFTVAIFLLGILTFSYLWDVQPAGRWLLPAVLPLTLFVLTGLWSITRARHRPFLSVGLLMFFLAFQPSVLTSLVQGYSLP